MAVMLALGLWGLDRGTMWRDESATYQMARRTVPQIRDALGTVDAVHGLYYLLMHPLLALHPSEVTMRLPSVLAAVAATALVAALGCRLARPRVGLWAGLLYAATPVVTHYAQEGRSYALVTAGAAWATYLLVGAAGLAVGAATGGAAGGVPADRSAPGPRATPADRPAPGPGVTPADRSASGPGATPADRPAPGQAATPGAGAVSRAAGPAGAAGAAGGPARSAAPDRAAGEAGRAASDARVRSAVLVRGGVPRVARAASAPGPERAASGAGWRWAAYGGVVAVTALLHVFAVLMLAAHALTLLVSRAPRRVWWGWGSASAGAVCAVLPLAALARRQSAQIAWIRHPTPGRLWAVVEDFAGPSALVLALNLLLIAVAVVRPRWRSLTAVALPLFCVPPVLLFALAFHRPCFHERYLLFGLAGIPLLAAAGVDRLAGVGMDGLARVVARCWGVAGVERSARVVAGRRAGVGVDRWAGVVSDGLVGVVAGWLARVVARCRAAVEADRLAGVVTDRGRAMLAGRRAMLARRRAVVGGRRAVVAAAGVLAVGCGFVWQLPLHQREREPLSRQDDLAALAAAVGRLTRSGEPVLYDPPKERRIAIAYPRPLAGLRDIALGTPGPASGTLYGVDVGPAELLRRLGGARSAWVIAADEPETRRAKTTVLTGRFRLAYSLCLPGIRLEHYVRAGPAG
ncbi:MULTISPECIES: glycosyltransferase family 39 protein [Streptomyces violaceusniger group]|uniref:Glycosyltransferase family 39 protein n=3 Tax=Streptomyces TaxID=1883 RepID=A0ABD5J1R3_9ACTN|nr:glycosyltransferase family 39 protein [Streptomyces violaceusniger]MEE4582296.1 glycosyltransferase family 39 protein [Streptomyces sp. DSM 41602]